MLLVLVISLHDIVARVSLTLSYVRIIFFLPAGAYDGCIVSPQAWSRGSQTRAHNPSFQGEAGYMSLRRSSPAHWEDGALWRRYSRYVQSKILASLECAWRWLS